MAAKGVYEAGEKSSYADPILRLDTASVDYYFSCETFAKRWRDQVTRDLGGSVSGEIISAHLEDWDKKWRESVHGVNVEPSWRILPIWKKFDHPPSDGKICLWMNPSLGFGAGTHPTTQLCLQVLGEAKNLKKQEILDFGSGSGILSVAAALRGARVDSVEIDPMALGSGRECASLNQVEDLIHFSEKLPALKTYDLILANILRPVLVEFSAELLVRLKRNGKLVLSGLLASDIEEVIAHYQKVALNNYKINLKSEIEQQGEWFRIIFKSTLLQEVSDLGKEKLLV